MTKIVLSKSPHFLGFKTEEQIRKLLCNFRRRKGTNDLLCVKHCAGHVNMYPNFIFTTKDYELICSFVYLKVSLREFR